MGDESRKIILQLEIDAAKSITSIVSLKDQVSKLKAEQKLLNLETTEGKKANEAYNAQIKALTKEQRSLELAVEKTAAGFQFETGSIASNRAELSKLTAEYKNLANPTKQQTEQIKNLSDRLKEQEGAIGNNTRNVGNYNEAISGVTSQIGMLVPEIGQLTAGFGGVTKSLQTVSKGFTTVGGAIKASGIGLLLVLLGSLIFYFKSTDEGAAKLEGALGAVGIVVKNITGFFAEMASGVLDVVSGATSLNDVFSGFIEFLEQQFKTRVNAAIQIITELKNILVELKDEGLSANLNDNLEKISDSTLDFTTGVKDSSDKIKQWAQELAAAAKIAFDYAVKLDAIEDAQRALNKTNALANQVAVELAKNAKDKTLSDQERITLIKKSDEIIEKSVKAQTALDRQRLSLIKERNKAESDAINQKLNRDIEEETSEEKKFKLRQKALSIQDKLSQEQVDLEVKIINAETSFISLRETNQNKIAVLEEKIAADREKAYQDYLTQLHEINAAEQSLIVQRQARIVSDLDFEIKAITTSTSQKIALIRIRGEEEKALQKLILDEKLAQLTSEGMKENANRVAIELEKTALIEQAVHDRVVIERKGADEITAINLAAEQKKTEDAKKEQEKRKQELVTGLQTTGTLLNNFANVGIQANAARLDRELDENESARRMELARSSKDQATQAKINKKFDDLAEEEKKKAARTDLDLKELQAVANIALGISQAIAQGGVAGIATGALVAAAGAVQIAAIESQKSKLEEGGVVVGPSHRQGGVKGTGRFNNIEVEGGEFVNNRMSTKNNAGLLNYINTHGRNRNVLSELRNIAPNRPPINAGKMATGGMIFDGGLSARQNVESVEASLSTRNLLLQAIAAQPNPIVLVKDINTGQGRNIEVKQRANVAQ